MLSLISQKLAEGFVCLFFSFIKFHWLIIYLNAQAKRPLPKISMIWTFSGYSVFPDLQKIKTSNIFFSKKNFRARAKKNQAPWNLGVVPFVSNPKKIYRNFSNDHSNSQKTIWRAGAVPIHKFCTSNIFFFAKNSLKLAKKKCLKYKIYGLAPRARAKFFFVNYYAH